MAGFSEGLLGGMRVFTGGIRDLVASGDALERRKRERELAPIRKELLQTQAQQAGESYRQSVARGEVLPEQLQQGLTRGRLGIGEAERGAERGIAAQPGLVAQAKGQSEQAEYFETQIDRQDVGRQAGLEANLKLQQQKDTFGTRQRLGKLQAKIAAFETGQAETIQQSREIERILSRADARGTDLTPDEINQIDDLSDLVVEKSAAGAAYMMYNQNDPEGAKIMMERNLPPGTKLLNWDDKSATLMLENGETVDIPAEHLKRIAQNYKEKGIEWDAETATFYDEGGGRWSTSGRSVVDDQVPELLADTWTYRQQLPTVMKSLGMKKNKAGNFVDRDTGEVLLRKGQKPDEAFFRDRKMKMGRRALQSKYVETFYKAEGLERIKAKYSSTGAGNPLNNFDFTNAAWVNRTMGEYFVKNTDEDGKLRPGAKEGLDSYMLAQAQQQQRMRTDPIGSFDQDIAQLEDDIKQVEAQYKTGAREKGWTDFGIPEEVNDMNDQLRRLKAGKKAAELTQTRKTTEAFLSQPKTTEFRQMQKGDTKLIGDLDEWKNKWKTRLDDEQKAQFNEISSSVRSGIPLTPAMREFLQETIKSDPKYRETAADRAGQQNNMYLQWGKGIGR